MARAKVKYFSYDEVKYKLMKLFGDKDSSSSSFDKIEVKSEPVFETKLDVLYGQSLSKSFSRGRYNGNRRSVFGGADSSTI